ncbi:response regulator transcription factor [Paenibacillus typhae]|uniref:response regulator transcription factor n=1 Tax=Paenibacillus typhae TaxID=1174501 RepID=UPI001C8DF0AE|nr:response regulator transcription factor [Paenibacillus typhae]MBY0012116.1 response regulator transcription factor [Paenibacillus typhae]
MSKLKVLIVDDEWNMRNLLRIYLMKEGFEIKEAATGKEALALVHAHLFDVIILDVMMPDMDGWQICRQIRERVNTPILFLSARTETRDKIKGLDIGADDYLTKPFDSEELLARLFSLIRRSVMNQTTPVQPARGLSFPDLIITPEAREVRICDHPIEFTQKEFDLLATLAQNFQRAYTREELVERLWGYDFEGEVRVVDTHIKNIREKMHNSGLKYNPIQTVWGVGYKFNISGDTHEK